MKITVRIANPKENEIKRTQLHLHNLLGECKCASKITENAFEITYDNEEPDIMYELKQYALSKAVRLEYENNADIQYANLFK